MYRRNWFSASLTQFLIGSLLVVLLITGCGSNVQPPSSVSNDLLVVSDNPFSCNIDTHSMLPDVLVMANSQTTFDGDIIQSLGQYVSNSAYVAMPPAGFQLLPIGQISDHNTVPCTWSLRITNRGDATIEVEQVQMQLHATPQQAFYHLIDICSLPLTRYINCPPHGLGGTGGTPLSYSYSFDLGNTNADRSLTGQLEGPIAPTLDSGDTVEVQTSFSLPSTAESMIYQVTPIITVDMPGKLLKQSITQERQMMAIVTKDQLDCYTLHGNTFIPLPSIFEKKAWCL